MYSNAVQVLAVIVVAGVFIPWALRHLWQYFKNINNKRGEK